MRDGPVGVMVEMMKIEAMNNASRAQRTGTRLVMRIESSFHKMGSTSNRCLGAV